MKESHYDTAKLLKQFDKHFEKVRSRLASHHGEAEADRIAVLARREFEALAPRIPYIGGRANVFTPVMVINGWIIALYRAMKSRGFDVEDVVRVSYEASDDFFRSFPRLVDRLAHRLATSRFAVRHLERQARRSQDRRYPEDFVYTCTARRRGSELELELEFSECAVQKYYDAEAVEELKPYCNFFDPIYSRYFALGVLADHTLGLGCSTCKLNFNNRRETRLPPNIEKLLAK